MAEVAASGSCLCGAVRYEVRGQLRPVVCCHCQQCRRTSGHYVAATATETGNLHVFPNDRLSWFRSSPKAQRGFCSACGSSMFWRPDHGRYVSIMAGTLDRPTNLTTACHIYVDSASDYYTLADRLPCYGEDYPDAMKAQLE